MERKKVYLILIFFLMFGLCLQFLTLPTIKKSQLTKTKLEERKAYLADRNKIIERIEQLQGEYKSQEDLIEKLDLALPVSSEVANALFQFQNFSTDSGLVMKDFSYSEGPDQEIPEAFSLSITSDFIGSYPSLKALLSKMEESLRIINVKSISFSAEIKEGEEGAEAEQIFPINLIAKLYYFPQKAVSGSLQTGQTQ